VTPPSVCQIYLKRIYLCLISFTEQATAPNTHRVPFGIHLLLLKLGELSPVVDDHQQLPDEQQG